jgi:hypothetical protein
MQSRFADGAAEKMPSLVEQSLVVGRSSLALGRSALASATVEGSVLANDRRLATKRWLLNIRLIRVVVEVEA